MINLQKLNETNRGGVYRIPMLIVFICFLLTSNSSLADISADIQALAQFSGDAKRAGYRLLNEGLAILPEAHSSITSSQSNLQQKMQLMTLLGEIGDASSVDYIITAAKQHPDNTYIQINALNALSILPQTPSSFNYAADHLRKPSSPQAQRSALWYFAKHKDSRALPWARKFSVVGADPRVRDAGLYSAAVLGDTSVKAEIAELLKSKPPFAKETNLLKALAHITNVQEFAQLTQKHNKQTEQYRSAERLVKFRQGSIDEKSKIAREILRMKSPMDIRMAVEYLVEQGASTELAPFMSEISQKKQILIKNTARKQGYKINKVGNTFELTK